MTLYLPAFALAEVRAVRPDAAAVLAEAVGHPSVVVGELDAVGAREVDQLLVTADVFDGCAGHVVYVARHRGGAQVGQSAPAQPQGGGPDRQLPDPDVVHQVVRDADQLIDAEIILDPHVTGECVIILNEDAATVLFEALRTWLGR